MIANRGGAVRSGLAGVKLVQCALQGGEQNMKSLWRRASALLIACAAIVLPNCANAADPIRVGMSLALTGSVAPIGKQVLAALQIWRDDVNAKGGLLGRPVELVFYDDQSNPTNIPQIYTKLIDVDKVELLIGPYATNMVVPAIPVLMPLKKTTIGILANAANSKFHYDQYFSMLPTGPEPQKAFAQGYFELAAAAKPRPKTVAIVAADAEFAQNAADGARQSIKEIGGFDVILDRNYPPASTDFGPIMRAVKAANPDVVFVAAYPPDSVGIIRAANEIGLTPKMFGGTFIGLLVTPIKMQLGPLINGIVNNVTYLPAPAFTFPGTLELLAKYQAIAPSQGIDPIGWSFVPIGYAAGQVLAQAVEGANSLDHVALAGYMRSHNFSTVVGDITFGKDGEWSKSRVVFTQFQRVTNNSIDQFKDTSHEVVVWPKQYKSGDMIYPYADAKNR
jgi:branched-chain amino acid transport system substrate-binding protein